MEHITINDKDKAADCNGVGSLFDEFTADY
jgi:hypothetical protein